MRCLISGRVQGVWYRAATAEQARNFGLSGHARNLPDGQVEVLACGDEEGLIRLEAWLWQGPSAARVDEVICNPDEETPPEGFVTK